jgi:hypothetical protein
VSPGGKPTTAALLGGVSAKAEAAEPWCASGFYSFCIPFGTCPFDHVTACYDKMAELNCQPGEIGPAFCGGGFDCEEMDNLRCFNIGAE